MKIVCDECEYVIDRDKHIEGKIVEEYNNIYGTRCPKCGNLIKSFKKVEAVDKLKIEMLREKIRDKIRRKINGNRRKK